MQKKTALIVGVTGLVGKSLLQLLLQSENYREVIAVSRRVLDVSDPKLTKIVIDFAELEDVTARLHADDVYCCLGTTIKQAKTKAAMYTVDVDYPLELAKLAHANGARQFLVISAMNANPNSRIFYPRIKGELEQKLAMIPYESMSFLRPSLLLGERDEWRFGEKAAEKLFAMAPFLFTGAWKKYQAISGEYVAKAMYAIAQSNKQGITVYPSEQLQSIAATL